MTPHTEMPTTDTDDAVLPATPDEQLQAAIDMDKVREYTVRPGLLRLPVSALTTAHNSPQYVVQLDHPVLGDTDTRFFIDKPAEWNTHREFWPRFLDWHGYTARSQYELQTDRVYVRHTPGRDRDTPGVSVSGDWTLVAPPSDARRYYWRWTDALAGDHPWLAAGWRAVASPVRRARAVTPSVRTAAILLLSVTVGLVAGVMMLTDATGPGVPAVELGFAVASAAAWAVFTLVVSAALIVPPGEVEGRDYV